MKHFKPCWMLNRVRSLGGEQAKIICLVWTLDSSENLTCGPVHKVAQISRAAHEPEFEEPTTKSLAMHPSISPGQRQKVCLCILDFIPNCKVRCLQASAT
jgi:hypothetical protein